MAICDDFIASRELNKRQGTMKLLTAEQKKFYDDNGYAVLDLLTEGEVDELSRDYDNIFKAKAASDTEATWAGDWKDDTKKKMEMKSIHGLQMYSGVFSRLLINPQVLDACEDLMGTPDILLHHTKAHVKPPGTGSPFPMHQDYHYFPFEKDSMIAVFLSLDASYPKNGGLCVYPGSHKLGPQKDVSTAPGYHYLDQKEFPIEKAVPLELKRGQIVIFSYLLIHGSYDNTSRDCQRRMFLVQLMSAHDTPMSVRHISDCQGMVLRGMCYKSDADIKKRHQAFTTLEEEEQAKRTM
ncbi:hypothetical protein Pcinc_025875 [Petrolisthes cinctipes]|uniref:phytanoyl-CoA dioxygenase n=1 Tax=Petrolisthes cinctipes TaxID=88211 RepID=A0AAE1F8D4_PETCI|nr:hypothetical protein Pcinc_025875 [Petrolisthes cinctipes]